eukprot:m.57946 g.57946  ORF g.57946 m.57946 type:complete len:244 (-) comp15629_c0_seq6:724-1455(-)
MTVVRYNSSGAEPALLNAFRAFARAALTVLFTPELPLCARAVTGLASGEFCDTAAGPDCMDFRGRFGDPSVGSAAMTGGIRGTRATERAGSPPWKLFVSSDLPVGLPPCALRVSADLSDHRRCELAESSSTNTSCPEGSSSGADVVRLRIRAARGDPGVHLGVGPVESGSLELRGRCWVLSWLLSSTTGDSIPARAGGVWGRAEAAFAAVGASWLGSVLACRSVVFSTALSTGVEEASIVSAA